MKHILSSCSQQKISITVSHPKTTEPFFSYIEIIPECKLLWMPPCNSLSRGMIYTRIYVPAGYMTVNLSLACNRAEVLWERKHPPLLPVVLKLDILQKSLNISPSQIVLILLASEVKFEVQTYSHQH